MKSLIELFSCVLRECGTRCGTSTLRDLETVHARTEHEGLSFLTITLPAFCREFEYSLAQKKVESTAFPGFGKTGRIPRFLGGIVSQVFCRETGALLDNPDIEAIRAVRQICLTFSKVELPCTENRIRTAYAGYIKCEQEVAAWNWNVKPFQLRQFSEMARKLFARVFSAVDHDVFYGLLLPKHGPGSTADGLQGNLKFTTETWTERLEFYFPAIDYLLGSYRQAADLESYRFLEPEAELPVKVISVPKTLKTPRIIAMEPTCMQYAQQALLASIREHMQKDVILCRMIDFSDQVPNQELAREGSSTGTLATLDLSDASDRVSNLLVQYLMLDHPHFDGAVQSCRSRTADVPGYGLVSLSKFASMGSALTFPMEAFTFLTCVFLGIEESLGHPLTRKEIDNLSRVVRVYGDDIVVPTDYVPGVVRSLESYGMKVNAHKSFWSGNFRESCGKEYFLGEDVTVARLKKVSPNLRRENVDEIESLVSFRNHLYYRGYWGTASYCDRVVRRVLPSFPVVASTSTIIGRESFLGYQTDRIGGRFQAPLVWGYTRRDIKPSSYIDDYAALLKVFLTRSDGLQPVEDKNHLIRAGRSLVATLKPGWSSPF